MVGGLIMCHGDDSGLRVPPRLAPIQALRAWWSRTATGVRRRRPSCATSCSDAGVRVALDDRLDTPFGRRAVDAELKGYPVRVEVGPRDLAEGNAVLVRRRRRLQDPDAASASVVSAVTAGAVEATSRRLYDEALAFRESAHCGGDHPGRGDRGGRHRLGPAAVGGGGGEGETRANEAGVTVRCLVRADGSVPRSEDEPDLYAVVARAY